MIGVIVGIFLMRFVSSNFLEQVFAFVILFVSLQMFFTTSEFKITKEFPDSTLKSLSAFAIGVLSKITGLTGVAPQHRFLRHMDIPYTAQLRSPLPGFL